MVVSSNFIPVSNFMNLIDEENKVQRTAEK